MFIEQIQMANISFSTCVIILQFKVFCFRDTQNFLGGAGGTTEASVGGFLGSSVQLPSKALSQAGLVRCLCTGYRIILLTIFIHFNTVSSYIT